MRKNDAFTLLELMTVMIIIAVLAALVLKGAGYAQNKAARSRAASEIAAISTALESYKADHGEYPHEKDISGELSPKDAPDKDAYTFSSAFLVWALNESSSRYLGDFPATSFSQNPTNIGLFNGLDDEGNKKTKTVSSLYLLDPFGNAYGYSTAKKMNPTYDLWSYAGNDKPTPDKIKDNHGYDDYPAPWWITNF